MTAIGGPCQCEVCGEWCTASVPTRAIVHGRGCLGRARCDCSEGETVVDGVVFTAAEREHLRSLRVADLEGAMLGYRMRALLAEAKIDEHAKRADLAEMRLAALGHEHRDLLCALTEAEEAARKIVPVCRARDAARSQLALAMHWGAELAALVERLCVIIRHDEERMVGAHDASMRGYTIGRRDGLACARQQAALVGDVLRAAEAWSDAGGDGLAVALHDAVDVWRAAGRPGLSEGE